MKRLCLTLLVTLTALLACVVQGKNLYPACDGEELKTSAGAGESVTVLRGTTEGTAFTLTCFAHEVTSVRGNQKDPSKDHCKIPHQTEYPYRLLVRAEYTDDSGTQRKRDFDLRDLSGGSVDGVTMRMNYPSRFSVIFVNVANAAGCTLSFHALLTYSVTTPTPKESVDFGYVPSVVAVRPATIYSGQPATLVLQFPETIDPTSNTRDRVFLIPLKERCESAMTISSMDTGSLPPSFSPLNPGSVYTAWSKHFSESGSYRLCHESRGKVSATVELAVLTSFSSNPAYFDILEGATSSGQVFTGVPVTVKFFGSDLDTRPNGDKAKLVEEDETCREGKAAGGVPVGTDLGPSDNFGANTTYSLWTMTILYGGAYKLCYQRAGMEAWAEVPYISTVDPGTAADTKETESAVPTPKNAETGDLCPMAPLPLEGRPWVKYQSVKLVMMATKTVQELTDTVVSLFCVPRSAFSITRLTHNKQREQVVYLAFMCDNVTSREGALVCDNTERANYAVSLGDSKTSELLKQYQIQSITGSTSMATSDDDPSLIPRQGSSTVGTLLVCLTVLGVVWMVAYSVAKCREKRQYMVQFGMDDADIDDMYAAGDVPLSGAVASFPAERCYELGPMTPPANHSRGAGVRDAMIEMED